MGNRALQWTDSQGLFTPLGPRGAQRVSVYADDLVMLIVPHEQDLLAVKTLLQLFGEASGLFANLDKSVVTPIHCDGAAVQRVINILGCRIENFPVKYLGVPLSIFRLTKSDEQAIIDKVAARIPL